VSCRFASLPRDVVAANGSRCGASSQRHDSDPSGPLDPHSDCSTWHLPLTRGGQLRYVFFPWWLLQTGTRKFVFCALLSRRGVWGRRNASGLGGQFQRKSYPSFLSTTFFEGHGHLLVKSFGKKIAYATRTHKSVLQTAYSETERYRQIEATMMYVHPMPTTDGERFVYSCLRRHSHNQCRSKCERTTE
jgi:hypothetical protein